MFLIIQTPSEIDNKDKRKEARQQVREVENTLEPRVAVASAWVSPRVKSAEPWAIGSSDVSMEIGRTCITIWSTTKVTSKQKTKQGKEATKTSLIRCTLKKKFQGNNENLTKSNLLNCPSVRPPAGLQNHFPQSTHEQLLHSDLHVDRVEAVADRFRVLE